MKHFHFEKKLKKTLWYGSNFNHL